MREKQQKSRQSTVAKQVAVPAEDFSGGGMLYKRCRRHPWMKSPGPCPPCLAARLEKLLCQDCGERRIFSDDSCCCSSEAATTSSLSSTNPSTSATNPSNKSKPAAGSSSTPPAAASAGAVEVGAVEVGSVGRISTLIDSDRPTAAELDAAVASAAATSAAAAASSSSATAASQSFFRRSRSVAVNGSRISFAVDVPNPSVLPKPSLKSSASYSRFFGFWKKKKSKSREDSDKESTASAAPARRSDFGVLPSRLLPKSRSVTAERERKSFSAFGGDGKGFKSNSVVSPSPWEENGHASGKGVGADKPKKNAWTRAFAGPIKAIRRSSSRRHDSSSPLVDLSRG